MKIDLSIIIVNWNSVEYLKECIASIQNGQISTEYEIIVVDSASFDGCAEMLKTRFPDVIFVQSKENIGFAGSNNLGYKYANGDTLLFLNPDTEIIGSAIDTMYTGLSTLKNAGAVGCRLLNSDMSLQTSCIQPFPTILNQFLDIELLKRVFPKAKLWGLKPLFFSSGKAQRIDAISGACLMIKSDIFKKVGLFSTDYFMYSEDVDLCYMVNKAGYLAYYIDEAKVVHHGGGSSSKKEENHFSNILLKESRSIFFSKTEGKTYASLYKLSTALASIVRLSALLVLSPLLFTSKKDSIRYAIKKWHKILRWSLGLEHWCKDLEYGTGK